MKTLLLMRHAKSDWKQPGLSDHDRPLNARGTQAAPAIADQLHASGQRVDVILSSSAVRAQQTVALLQRSWCPEAPVLTCPELYLASPQRILAEVQTLDDRWHAALVVAHNPGMAALVSSLASKSLEMPTAAVAIFQFQAEHWNRILSGPAPVLSAYWKPRQLTP